MIGFPPFRISTLLVVFIEPIFAYVISLGDHVIGIFPEVRLRILKHALYLMQQSLGRSRRLFSITGSLAKELHIDKIFVTVSKQPNSKEREIGGRRGFLRIKKIADPLRYPELKQHTDPDNQYCSEVLDSLYVKEHSE